MMETKNLLQNKFLLKFLAVFDAKQFPPHAHQMILYSKSIFLTKKNSIEIPKINWLHYTCLHFWRFKKNNLKGCE